MSLRTHRGDARAPLTEAGGRHELGQNFLADRRVIDTVIDLVATTTGPILEIGAGAGALTLPLARLGRPITALELDPRLAAALAARSPATVRVEHSDALAHRFEARPHVVVSNLPFHLTTALLRRLLHAPGWTEAVLIAQWEVARRRAEIGGGTLLTAQASPWFTCSLHDRIPRAAFRPRPQVDGGLFVLRRRAKPLVPPAERRAFERLVGSVFHAHGRGLAATLAAAGALPPPAAKRWARERSLPATAFARDLQAEDWASLWDRHRRTPGQRRT